jgi:hypothetical protein
MRFRLEKLNNEHLRFNNLKRLSPGGMSVMEM